MLKPITFPAFGIHTYFSLLFLIGKKEFYVGRDMVETAFKDISNESSG
jgi:hypothetical protein